MVFGVQLGASKSLFSEGTDCSMKIKPPQKGFAARLVISRNLGQISVQPEVLLCFAMCQELGLSRNL